MGQSYLTRRAALLAGSTAWANPARAHAEPAAIAPIRQLNDGLLRIMQAGPGVPFATRFDMLAPVIDQVFDLDAVLRASVGLAWDSLPPNQQDQLRPVFRRYTIVSYVNSFNSFDGQRFTVQPLTRPSGKDEQIVSTRIVPPSGDGHELDYVMRNTPNGWRAVDVLAEGSISRVAVQRSDFRHLLSRGGAQALTSSLASKAVDLSDGMS
jgi:phospholipid transport system substrate-binding protein